MVKVSDDTRISFVMYRSIDPEDPDNELKAVFGMAKDGHSDYFLTGEDAQKIITLIKKSGKPKGEPKEDA